MLNLCEHSRPWHDAFFLRRKKLVSLISWRRNYRSVFRDCVWSGIALRPFARSMIRNLNHCKNHSRAASRFFLGWPKHAEAGACHG